MTLAALAAAGLGEERLGEVLWEKGKVLAQLERVYAGRVLAARRDTPAGPLARQSLAALYLRGTLWKKALPLARERIERAALALRLGHADAVDPTVRAHPALEAWVAARLAALGVEHGDDAALLSPEDLVPQDVPDWVREAIERHHPHTVSVGDAVYRAAYDLDARRVLLTLVRGQRHDPPPRAYLPRFEGLTVSVCTPRGTTVLRG